jgi:hypothetical protein
MKNDVNIEVCTFQIYNTTNIADSRDDSRCRSSWGGAARCVPLIQDTMLITCRLGRPKSKE